MRDAFHFAKYEGIGNDFIVIDADRHEVDWLGPRQARSLCDRHLGIGADGVLLTGTRDGRPFMRVLNADGSQPEMCGNGIRCVALHLVHRRHLDPGDLSIDTDAGPHRCHVLEANQVEVAMRPATLDPAEVPVDAAGALVDAPFEVAGHVLRLTALSLGNPHAVTFDVLSEAERCRLGPALGTDGRFFQGVNAGFARLDPTSGIALEVFERGAGWTRACGTGACAAAVAAVETGRAPRREPIRVRLPGGTLTVVVPERGQPVRMIGPARHVFDGVVSRAAATGEGAIQ